MSPAWDRGPQPQRNQALLATVQGIAGKACAGCGASLCGHAAVLSVVLGYKAHARCAACLAAESREDAAELAERCLQWVQRRECFLRGWQWASEQEGQPGELRPACAWPPSAVAPVVKAAAAAAPAARGPDADASWDAGDMGCGDLVLELRHRLRAMQPSTVLLLRARDPGAPEDIPAWCGLTGHTLVAATHPEYWIRRKTD